MGVMSSDCCWSRSLQSSTRRGEAPATRVCPSSREAACSAVENGGASPSLHSRCVGVLSRLSRRAATRAEGGRPVLDMADGVGQRARCFVSAIEASCDWRHLFARFSKTSYVEVVRACASACISAARSFLLMVYSRAFREEIGLPVCRALSLEKRHASSSQTCRRASPCSCFWRVASRARAVLISSVRKK